MKTRIYAAPAVKGLNEMATTNMAYAGGQGTPIGYGRLRLQYHLYSHALYKSDTNALF